MNIMNVPEETTPPSSQNFSNTQKLIEHAGTASELLKALSHESRLVILCTLLEKERSVMELEKILSQRQSTVSQQLARLRADKLVKARRHGQTMYYSLISEEAKQIVCLLANIYADHPTSPT